MMGGPQPFATNAAASALNLPGADKLPGLGTDLAAQVDEETKLRKKRLDDLSLAASPAAAALLGGVKLVA